MKTLIFALILLIAPFAYAEPEVNVADIENALKRALATDALYWNPFPLPYEISKTSVHKDARFLKALFKHGLLQREEFRVQIAGTKARPQYEEKWRYSYHAGRNPYSPEGFYYGRGHLVKVLEMSAVQNLRGVSYVNVRVSWSVNYLQDWAKDPIFSQARTLRRSQQSHLEPFEKDVVLQYNKDGGYWQLWQEPEF